MENFLITLIVSTVEHLEQLEHFGNQKLKITLDIYVHEYKICDTLTSRVILSF